MTLGVGFQREDIGVFQRTRAVCKGLNDCLIAARISPVRRSKGRQLEHLFTLNLCMHHSFFHLV